MSIENVMAGKFFTLAHDNIELNVSLWDALY